ncbi:hypothetical protein Tco_1374113 [Tanacetum coccineum]
MVRDTIQLENAVSTISQEYLLEFTSEYGIPEGLHPELPGPEETIVDFLEGKVAGDTFWGTTGTRPRAAHEVPLLTVTASRVIEMEDASMASESSETPSTIEKSPLDFANEDPPQTITERGGTEDRVQDKVAYEILSTGNASTTGVALKTGLEEEVAAMGPLVIKGRRKREYPWREIPSFNGVRYGLHLYTPAAQDLFTATKSVSDLEPLSYAKPQPDPEQDMAQSSKEAATEIPTEKVATTEVNIQFSVGSSESGRLTSVPSVVRSPGSIYQPGWGVTNDCRLDTLDTCQDMVDHIVLPRYFSELRYLPNADFLSQYNINLAQQMAMGS